MRKWIDIIRESQEDPSEIVHKLRDRWVEETGKTPQQINAGMCFDFADELASDHPELFFSVGLGNFMNHDCKTGQNCWDATGFDLELLRLHYPAWHPPQGWTWKTMFEVVNDGCHGWAICKTNGLCYDIEVPDGIANPFELPWFKRFFAALRSKTMTESQDEDYDEDYEDFGWEPYDLDTNYMSFPEPGRLPATPENIARAQQFVFKKWLEYHQERAAYGGPNAKYHMPTDLTNSCKFSSLFAREIFGGRLRGNEAHQFVEAPDGTIIDLNIDADDVKQLGDYAHRHMSGFWGNPDHRDSVNSCIPRVGRWVEEFMREMNIAA